MSTNPRNRNGGARRAAAVRWLRCQGLPCWVCGMPIDYGAPAGDPLAFECDELVPVSLGGSPTDHENLAPAHRCCNNWRKAKPVQEVELIRSRAAAAFGPWSSPAEFVSWAKLAARRERLSAASKPPRTTTDW